VNARGEVASRGVLLKSELAAFVSAMKETAQEIWPKMGRPADEVWRISAQSNCESQDLNSKNPWVMFTKNSVLLLEEERGKCTESKQRCRAAYVDFPSGQFFQQGNK